MWVAYKQVRDHASKPSSYPRVESKFLSVLLRARLRDEVHQGRAPYFTGDRLMNLGLTTAAVSVLLPLSSPNNLGIVTIKAAREAAPQPR
jgi:hypothetical protein